MSKKNTSTNEVLVQSFKELAIERPIEKITIKEITDRAGVIRPTFYNHFQDKYELMEWMIKEEILNPVRPLISAGMIKEAMVLMFTNIQKDQAYYSKAIRLEGVITFHQIAMKVVTEMLGEIVGELMSGKTPKHKWLTADVVTAYYAQSMVFACEEWIKSGFAITPAEMGDAYHYIMTRSMEDVVKEL